MYILDRFEENIAVIEYTDKNGDISILKVGKSQISPDTDEGDVLTFNGNMYYADKKATDERRRKMLEMFKNRIK